MSLWQKPSALPLVSPRTAGFDPKRLDGAAQQIAAAVESGGVPGAVLLVARHGLVALRQAWGWAGLRPERRSLACDTAFDLASLTKPIACGSALGVLLDQGKLALDDPLARYLPAFAAAGGERAQVTIRHFATHCAGIPAGGAYAGKTITLEQIVADIARSRRLAAPGERFVYSDFSAIALGAVVEAVAQQPLDRFCQEQIFAPLGMTDTTFWPSVRLVPRCAATVAGDDTPATRGRVHDPIAAALERAGAVSGNAGLFSTVDDLARFAQFLLNRGSFGGRRLLHPEMVALLTRKQSPLTGPDGERGILWDLGSAYAIRGELAVGSFGHTGFTGTSIWIDPHNDCFVILLTNAVHAGSAAPKGGITPLRRQLSTAVARALLG